MIRILSITLERFGSFKTRQTFEFPTAPGLYFMTGRNEAEPGLERNGAGKSTVWNALTWAFFGKGSRGLGSTAVVNWQEPKDACVTVIYEDDGVQVELFRTHAPNAWKLSADGEDWIDLTKDDTNELRAALQLSYSMWLQTVVMAQDEPMFLDLPAPQKAAMFTEVMRLERWDGFIKRAGMAAVDHSAVTAGIWSEIDKIETRIADFGRHEEAFDAESAEFERERGHKLDMLAKNYELGLKKVKELKAELDVHATEIDLCRVEYEPLKKRVAQHAEVTHQVGLQERECFVYSAQSLTRQDDTQDALEELEAGECPTCGSTHVEEAREHLERRLRVDIQHAHQAAEDLRKVRDLEASAMAEEKKARGKLDACLQAIDRAEASFAATRNDLASVERMLDNLEDEVEECEKKENPHARYSETAAADGASLRLQHGSLSAELEAQSEHGARLGFWVQGFKDIRLQLVGEALVQLEAECAGALESGGLVGWRLRFEIDRETKSGGVVRGFNVYVQGPSNKAQVPWESWSGGEAQRLRVAAQCGLSNLIRSSTGSSIALEVWDEPTSGMSGRGIVDLLQSLRDRAQVEQRVIFVVDHHALGFGEFDGAFTVVKDAQGSRIEVN